MMTAPPSPSAAALDHLVIGANVSGLWAALLLARSGRRVRVLDKAAHALSAADAAPFRGVPCDLGTQRLRPSALEHPLFREMRRDVAFTHRSNRGVLLFEDRQIPFPPAPLAMVQALGPMAGLSLGAGLFARTVHRHALSVLRRSLPAPGREVDPGFEDFMIARVGQRAYDAFYRPYAEKLWGVPPTELSQSAVQRRIRGHHVPSRSQSLAERAVDWIEGGAESPEPTDGFMVPAGGMSTIVGWLEDRLSALQVPIERGRAFTRSDLKTGPILFAGELGELVETTLQHRGLYRVWLAFPAVPSSAASTYHSSDARHWFTKVTTQVGSAAGALPGETVLCVEIPEGRWGAQATFTFGERLSSLLDQLASAGIIPREMHPIETRQHFIADAYPLHRRGWRREWHRAMKEVIALRSVLPIDPRALFLTGDLDQCADLAQAAVRHVSSRLSVESWIAQTERG